jgi:hypothetical protein
MPRSGQLKRKSLEPRGDDPEAASVLSDRPQLREGLREDDAFDVPATVVCALCGDADCPGCANERSRSGIVSIVAWERPGPTLARLWSTARSASVEAEPFFATLPDGPILPALRFAALSELCASAAMLAFGVPFAAILAPSWLAHLGFDPLARATTWRIVLLGIPALATMLVLAHATHGLALDLGARKVGAPAATRRALRFGLYATGWDVVIGPLGALLLAFQRNKGGAVGVSQLAVGLPGRSARAFLRGAYGLDGLRAAVAVRTSNVTAVIVTLLGALAILAAVGILALA